MDRTRASDAERERVAGRLRNAAAQGRLTMEELDDRTAATAARAPMAARHCAFTTRWRAPADRFEAQADLMEFVAPPMHRYGYDLVERGGETLLIAQGVAPLAVRRAFAGLQD